MSRIKTYKNIRNLSIGLTIFYVLFSTLFSEVDQNIYYDIGTRAFLILIFGGKALAEYHIFYQLKSFLILKYNYNHLGDLVKYFIVANLIGNIIIYIYPTDLGSLVCSIGIIVSQILKIIIGFKLIKNIKETNMFIVGLTLMLSSIFILGDIVSIVLYIFLAIIFNKAFKQGY